MLTRLLIRNYVLIDSLEITFPEGLIIITGQTGAGKSILLGALSLLMGAKADVSMVSGEAENCVVEAEFEVGSEVLRSVLEENEIEWEDGHLTVRRVVNRSGRSRAFVNDSPVAQTLLQEISSHLIDIHSQHQTLLLSDRHFQLDILDLFADNLSLRERCAGLWKTLGQKKNELRDIEERLSRIALEKDYNEAQYRQLESASLREGELAELEEEQTQLANAGEIKASLGAVEEMFAPSSDMLSVDASLKEMEKLLSRAGRFVPSAVALSERVESCRRELEDIYSDVIAVNSRVDMSPERLAQVEDRMSLLYSLMKKHGCSDEAELIAVRDRLSEDLYDSSALEERKEQMKKEIALVEADLDQTASQLSRSRTEAAGPFAQAMTTSVRGLELQYAIFEVGITEIPVGQFGKDAVTFRFSATGRDAVDIAKCASGGELSRIMLALKAMRAKYAKMPTMIFDEIDTGVSGSVADKMGSMICDMGEYMQVFAITHLPQVAAKGTAHYLVTKDIDPLSSKAVSTIERISGESRVLEIARMLSGSTLTDAAIANAESLLQN